tara:strand:+ start:21907 stop:22155 length:249 start_codon:yes stop_codon:yes gene_type:complete
MDDKAENRLKRRYVSALAAIVLAAYVGYIVFRKLKFGAVSLDNTDYAVLSVCLAVLLAVEAVRYYIRKKMGSNPKNDENDAT